MKQINIGLVLSGGGARGAYQLGVMLAMEKYGLTKNVSAIAGGSIGSFSMMGFLMKDYYRAYQTFKDMNSERVLGYKRNIINKIPILGQGLFTRDNLITYLLKNYNLGNLVNTNIPLYVSAAKETKDFIKVNYEIEYFKINHLRNDEVLKILLASSAIPYVFDEVKINNNYYVDCMKADSEPFLPLLKENIDCLFIVPLTNSHVTAKYKNLNIPVVDFESLELRNSPIINMLAFEPDKVDAFLNCGYYTGINLLQALTNKKEKLKDLPPYSSLESLGINFIPERLLTIDEIILDVKNGEIKNEKQKYIK